MRGYTHRTARIRVDTIKGDVEAETSNGTIETLD